jgi:hypothetical protein
VTLRDDVYRQAVQLAKLANCRVADLLSEGLTLLLPPLSAPAEISQPVETLSDDEVIALAEREWPRERERRLQRLLDRQQAGRLTTAERPELLALLQDYQVAVLRKAQARREAVRRRLREPLTP